VDKSKFFENIDVIADAPNGIRQLRGFIFALAVSGDLTSQSNDEVEAPVGLPSKDLPCNWRVCMLDEIAEYGGHGQVASREIPDDAWVLDLEDIEKGTSRILARVRAQHRATKGTKSKFSSGDVLYGKLRPYLNKVLLADDDGFCTTEIVPIVPSEYILPEYLVISLKSPSFLDYADRKSYGMKMPRLGTKDAKSSLHNLPPLPSQKRIVAKVDELTSLCDELDAQMAKRESLRTAARKSALDAISTAQTEEELQTAWRRIGDKWETLADSPSAIIFLRGLILNLAFAGHLTGDLEKSNWMNAPTLKDVGMMIRGITYAKAESTKEQRGGFVPLLGAANIQRSINYTAPTYVPAHLIKPNQYLVRGDVLICMSSGSKKLVGKAALVQEESEASFGAFCAVFRPGEEINNDYLGWFFQSPQYRLEISSLSRGIGINNLRIGDIGSLHIPLPPLSVQGRVVAKVDQLMSLCDELEKQQILRHELREKFAESVLAATD
jgi:type I restriction enzyme S subunit